MKSPQLSALKSAERFVIAERKVREHSYLPNPTDAERRDLEDAIETQGIIQRAIVQGETTPDPMPELLKACKGLMPRGWDDGTMDHMPGIRFARLAITKAESLGQGGRPAGAAGEKP